MSTRTSSFREGTEIGRNPTGTPVEQIGDLVSRLSLPQQEELLRQLRRQVLLASAAELDDSVRSGKTIPMQEIVEEVRVVRKKRHEQPAK